MRFMTVPAVSPWPYSFRVDAPLKLSISSARNCFNLLSSESVLLYLFLSLAPNKSNEFNELFTLSQSFLVLCSSRSFYIAAVKDVNWQAESELIINLASWA